MSHAVTAQDLFFEMKRMPPAERVKFFALLSENAFRDDDFSHGQVFGHLEGETLSAGDNTQRALALFARLYEIEADQIGCSQAAFAPASVLPRS